MDNDGMWEFRRRATLARLIQALGDVLEILRLDAHCRWTPHFEEFLQAAERLSDEGFTQPELVELSHSIRRTYDKFEGNFERYRPPTGLPSDGLHGTNNFETFKTAALESAMQLRCRVPGYAEGMRSRSVNPQPPNSDSTSESN
jgi:hypothetical protein